MEVLKYNHKISRKLHDSSDVTMRNLMYIYVSIQQTETYPIVNNQNVRKFCRSSRSEVSC